MLFWIDIIDWIKWFETKNVYTAEFSVSDYQIFTTVAEVALAEYSRIDFYGVISIQCICAWVMLHDPY